MQRLFSTFPGGWPGLGLLLLRLTVAFTTATEGVSYFLTERTSNPAIWIVCLLGIAAGSFLVVGFLTPIVSVFSAAGTAAIAWVALPTIPAGLMDVRLEALEAVIVAMAVAFLGPGAFSLDALFFGRREIIIPDAADSSKNQ